MEFLTKEERAEKTSTLNQLMHYSNKGLKATYAHVQEIQNMAKNAKVEDVVVETQQYLDAIKAEAAKRKTKVV